MKKHLERKAQRAAALDVLVGAYRFRSNSDVGYLLNDGDIIRGIVERTDCDFSEAEEFFDKEYPLIRKNRVA